MSLLRRILWKFFRPVFPIVMRGSFKLNGYKRLQIGKLTFWGPQTFLDTCEIAVIRLAAMDEELHRVLTTQQRLVLFRHPKLIQARRHGYFSVSDRYVEWRSDGVIALMVWISYFVSLDETDGVSWRHGSNEKLATMITQWLADRSFPERLVNAFSRPSQTGARE